MRKLLFLFLFIVHQSISYSQSGDGHIQFAIEQSSGGSGGIYIFDSGEIKIYTYGQEEAYTVILNKDHIRKIDSAYQKIGIENLENTYKREVVEGVYRIFKFLDGSQEKKIVLSNYFVKELDSFLRFINTLIPEDKIQISFGNIYLQSDTLIRYLPDLYSDTVILPDSNYNFYRIMCFKNGYGLTDDPDSIVLCDCRIYPTRDNGKFIKRNYWRAYRTPDENWLREYYDNKGKIVKKDSIVETKPYEISSEKIYYDRGNKPSVIIEKYYKTTPFERK